MINLLLSLKNRVNIILGLLVLVLFGILYIDYKQTRKIIQTQNKQIENLEIQIQMYQDTIDRLKKDRKKEISYLKQTYNKQLLMCKQSKQKIKTIVKYKPIIKEKIKVIKELEKCNIVILETNHEEINDPIYRTLLTIGK